MPWPALIWVIGVPAALVATRLVFRGEETERGEEAAYFAMCLLFAPVTIIFLALFTGVAVTARAISRKF